MVDQGVFKGKDEEVKKQTLKKDDKKGKKKKNNLEMEDQEM